MRWKEVADGRTVIETSDNEFMLPRRVAKLKERAKIISFTLFHSDKAVLHLAPKPGYSASTSDMMSNS
jgi:hypothetical protein